jgi:hypothetical protein
MPDSVSTAAGTSGDDGAASVMCGDGMAFSSRADYVLGGALRPF